jgi:hypothetical protein
MCVLAGFTENLSEKYGQEKAGFGIIRHTISSNQYGKT